LLLNGLNYRPRPVFADFIAIGEFLEEQNANRFKQQKDAPDFVFVNSFGFRNCDTRAFLSILLNYEVIDVHQKHAVLRKRGSSDWVDYSMHRGDAYEVGWGEWFMLRDRDKVLSLRLAVPERPIYKLWKMVSRPEKVAVQFRLEDGTQTEKEMSLLSLKSGIWVNPYLKSSKEFLSWLLSDTEPLSRLEAFRIKLIQPSWANFFDETISVRFDEVSIGEAGPLYLSDLALRIRDGVDRGLVQERISRGLGALASEGCSKF